MILLGFVLGRWWKVTVPLAALAWPLMLVVGGIHVDASTAVEAAVLGVANAAVGAAIYLAMVDLGRIVARCVAPDASP